jgi:hypothetical protein
MERLSIEDDSDESSRIWLNMLLFRSLFKSLLLRMHPDHIRRLKHSDGRAMAQAVSCRLSTAVAQDRTQVII